MSDRSRVIDLTLDSDSDDDVMVMDGPRRVDPPRLTIASLMASIRCNPPLMYLLPSLKQSHGLSTDELQIRTDLMHVIDLDLGPPLKCATRFPQDEPEELERIWRERTAKMRTEIQSSKVSSFQYNCVSERRELIYGFENKKYHHADLEKLAGWSTLASHLQLQHHPLLPMSKHSTLGRSQLHGCLLYSVHDATSSRVRFEASTSGGVNTIIQHGSYAVAASNVQAGTRDDVPGWNSDCQTVDHSSSSRSGGLLYKKHNTGLHNEEKYWETVNTHFVKARVTRMYIKGRNELFNTIGVGGEAVSPPKGIKLEPRHEPPYNHYFTCYDVAFDPTNPGSFVSASADGTVKFWTPLEGSIPFFEPQHPGEAHSRDSEEPLGSNNLYQRGESIPTATLGPDILDPDGLGASPSKILFRPNSSIVAICTDKAGVIHLVDNQDMDNGAVSLEVSTASHHVTYETHAIWGRAYSSDRLFAGTCRDDGHSDGGTVTMFSTIGDASWISDPFSKESGNCQGLALDSQGKHLLVLSNSSSYDDGKDLYACRVYDVRAGLTEALIPLGHKRVQSNDSIMSAPTSSIVTTVTISPDDVLFAISQSNNTVNIYDFRYIRSTPLYTCFHAASAHVPDDHYGVTCLQWYTNYHRGPNILLSGGGDGTVRLWDLRRALEDTGEVICQMPSGIGYFHCGDIYQEELPLIVGDCDGKLLEFREAIYVPT